MTPRCLLERLPSGASGSSRLWRCSRRRGRGLEWLRVRRRRAAVARSSGSRSRLREVSAARWRVARPPPRLPAPGSLSPRLELLRAPGDEPSPAGAAPVLASARRRAAGGRGRRGGAARTRGTSGCRRRCARDSTSCGGRARGSSTRGRRARAAGAGPSRRRPAAAGLALALVAAPALATPARSGAGGRSSTRPRPRPICTRRSTPARSWPTGSPAVLADGGLGPTLGALAEEASVPIRLDRVPGALFRGGRERPRTSSSPRPRRPLPGGLVVHAERSGRCSCSRWTPVTSADASIAASSRTASPRPRAASRSSGGATGSGSGWSFRARRDRRRRGALPGRPRAAARRRRRRRRRHGGHGRRAAPEGRS